MDPKPFASLSAGLLARKGAARPAMRRPHVAGMAVPTLPVSVQEDDLGWNDMGHERHPAPLPVPPLVMNGAKAPTDEPPGEPPVVVRQQEELAHSFAQPSPQPVAPPAPQPVVDKAEAPEPVAETAPKPVTAAIAMKKQIKAKMPGIRPRVAKAAFTLRLDPERHLRLRLACAVGNRSAQQIVTQALDAFLDSQPQLETLARQVPQDGADDWKSN